MNEQRADAMLQRRYTTPRTPWRWRRPAALPVTTTEPGLLQRARRGLRTRSRTWRPALLAAWAIALGMLALAVPSTSQAHEVWLEQTPAGARLYFGEFGDNLHEVSPGYLDKLGRPSASLVSARGAKPLDVRAARDAIEVQGRAGKGESLVALDAAYPLMESKDGDKVVRNAWTPAARYVTELQPVAPVLTLDIVPTNAGGEFQVTFRGAPLPEADVSLVAASGWSLRGATDTHGKVSFRLPWKGTYVLLVRHKELQPGKRPNSQGGEEAFDTSSFATTLTFATKSGLPSPPRPPPAPPNALK